MDARQVYTTGATLLIPVAVAGSTTPDWQEAQIALLHIEPRPHRRTLRLMASLRVALTVADHVTCGHTQGVALDTSDLIFFEMIGRLTPDATATLQRVRAGRKTPLVVFTDALRPECTARAIEAGADAVLSLTTAPAIIAARCAALLRRWQPAGSAAPRPTAISEPC